MAGLVLWTNLGMSCVAEAQQWMTRCSKSVSCSHVTLRDVVHMRCDVVHMRCNLHAADASRVADAHLWRLPACSACSSASPDILAYGRAGALLPTVGSSNLLGACLSADLGTTFNPVAEGRSERSLVTTAAAGAADNSEAGC